MRPHTETNVGVHSTYLFKILQKITATTTASLIYPSMSNHWPSVKTPKVPLLTLAKRQLSLTVEMILMSVIRKGRRQKAWTI